MKHKLGDWLMDIAKYVATAVILSTIFSTTENRITIIAWGIAAMLSALLWGLYLNKNDKNKKINKK